MEAVVNDAASGRRPASADFSKAFGERSVLVTGHTGFKGAWLSLWLARLGARVHGYALAPETEPSLFRLANVEAAMASHTLADVRDSSAMRSALQAAAPEVVFHLAAQALVRRGYRDPVANWATNVMGTVHLLEAVRACPSVKAVVIVTSDKCYENREWFWGYREGDPLGGHDPYSSSKAAAELVAQSYRRSYFSASGPLLASARAGNVIGGGDWSEDRLIPDAVRAVSKGVPLQVRSPGATRPWQHVLESLHGYLRLAARLADGDERVAEAFNFGPEAADNRTVADVLDGMQNTWPDLRWELEANAEAPHEANFLYLDSSKAQRVLGWRPRWRLERALAETADWYRSVLADPTIARRRCDEQIDAFSNETDIGT